MNHSILSGVYITCLGQIVEGSTDLAGVLLSFVCLCSQQLPSISQREAFKVNQCLSSGFLVSG
jgi:hypothetical protein